MKFFESNYQTIGNTPTVELKNINKGLKGKLYAKLESRNPSFSVKDRIGYAMIIDALRNKKLKEGMTIIEPTSGNTGIALAMMGASLDFKVKLAMPESMSIERRAIMQMYGAELLLTPADKGMKGAIDAANELLKNDPDKFFMPSQFDNPANPKIHEATTGPEIYYALNGKIDYFVAGVGTGGTISGVSRFLKRVSFNKVKSVAVEPAKSPAISYFLDKKDFTPAPHKIQGIGAGFIPKNLDLNLIDEVMQIEDEEAIDFARRLFKEEGIMAGISSGANFAAAYKIAQKDESKDLNIVFVVCDTGERYLSTDLFKI
ncbi:cysteine synthase A [Deferribacter thermophilus]|uniref:cysteine synthase A n=1 Tax=Deferribacter thermophilus TaxID=53573 RepID=UPI003C1F7A64